MVSYVESKAMKHASKATLEKFNQILSRENVGLLVTQRMINIPSETVPALHSELAADLAFTKKCDEIDDPREFDYSYLLVITR